MRALLTAFVVALPLSAVAAELPAHFVGKWRITSPSDNTCRPLDEDYAIEGHMIVTPGEVLNFEQHCRVVSVKMTRPPRPEGADAEVTFACAGEGMRWSERVIWHSEVIDGRKAVAVTLLSQSNWRDQKGRRGKPPSQIGTSIYFACG